MHTKQKNKIGGLSPDLIKQIIDVINSKAKPKKIILYGSRARGDYSKTSDIDLALENISATGLIKDALEEQVNTLLFFDVVRLESIRPCLRHRIFAEGKVLYEQ
ncbi:DNA polymerase beta domain protein region [Candidatus Magnetomoraceae bacterium gMMP-1]